MSQSFKLELHKQEPEEAIIVPAEASTKATIAINNDNEPADDGFDKHFVDNFDGICWEQLPKFIKLLHTQKHKKS